MSKIASPTVQYTTFEELLDRDGYLVYTNVGNSMLPLLRQNRDILVIRKKGPERCRKYDAVLYRRNGTYILHRVLKVRPRDYVIAGDHCIWREYGITDDQILGVMERLIRGGRTVTPDSLRYRLYVHLWCDLYPLRAAILYGKRLLSAVAHKITGLLRRGPGNGPSEGPKSKNAGRA